MRNSHLRSIMSRSDSYKGTMKNQYPKGTEIVRSYIEARGGIYAAVEFLGIQAVTQELAIPITQAQIDFAEKVWAGNGLGDHFNREGWEYILKEHGGKLPVIIKAVPEGTVIPTKNVLCTIENTDPQCWWLTTWIETILLRAIWYPTTVGTKSYHIKKIIKQYLEKSGDVSGLPFKLHDFGARGVSSAQSAEIGGAAHLVNFMGTDTIEALPYINEVYGDPLDSIGYSIVAAEHSTITSWGREHELDAYENMLDQFARKGSIVAVVSDSYDIYNACKMWGTSPLKEKIIASEATLVIRPDSGDPLEVIPRMLAILAEKFGVTVNAKGYKVLNYVRIIWGDGINAQSLESILRTMVDLHGFSADNFAFGMGGGLLQQLDRDTHKFAMKCSAVAVREFTPTTRQLDGYYEHESKLVWRDVFKDPITDSGKTSKKGRVTLWKSGGEYVSSVIKPTGWADKAVGEWTEALVVYYENGELPFSQTFVQVRANAEASLV